MFSQVCFFCFFFVCSYCVDTGRGRGRGRGAPNPRGRGAGRGRGAPAKMTLDNRPTSFRLSGMPEGNLDETILTEHFKVQSIPRGDKPLDTCQAFELFLKFPSNAQSL